MEENQVKLPQEGRSICDRENVRAKIRREWAADELRKAFFSINIIMEGMCNIGDEDHEVSPLEISAFLRRVADEVDALHRKQIYTDLWRDNGRWTFTKTCIPKNRLEELAGYLDVSEKGAK